MLSIETDIISGAYRLDVSLSLLNEPKAQIYTTLY